MNTEHSPHIDHAAVAHASALVTQTGILDTFDRWRAEDNITRRGGLVSERAVLVGLMLLAREQSPLSLTLLGELLHRRLTSPSRQLLDLPALGGSESTDETKPWVNRTQAAFHRMLGLMDPAPKSASARSFREVSAILDGHDVVLEAKMRARLREFSDAYLLMTFAQQPPRMRETNASIDLAINQIPSPSPTGTGFSRTKLARRVAEESVSGRTSRTFRPVDAFADWYRLYELDSNDDEGRYPARGKFGWGWMTNIAVRVDSGAARKPQVPPLVVGATLSMPREGVADAAVQLMRSALGTGLTPGSVHADNAYFAHQRIERLHVPTAELGFTPVTDYLKDRLGVHDYKNGAVFIEGKVYCPEMPRMLQNASIDFQEGHISAESYRLRIQARTRFELRLKSGPDKNGRYRMAHPTANVFCNRKHPSERTGRVCAPKSVTFERTDGLSHRQAHTYMSSAWVGSRQRASLALEAFNAGFRTLQGERPGSGRRVAGFAAAQVLMTVELAAYNLRVLDRFVRQNPED